jgi:hypothetical protein
MIDHETADESYALLATAILELLEDGAGTMFPMPKNASQKRTHMAHLADLGRDITTLATASLAVLRAP